MANFWSIRTPWETCVQIDEFGAGTNDACGPYALENLRANYLQRAPEYGGGEAIRARMIASGCFTVGGGTTLACLKTEIEQRESGNVGPVLDFVDWQDGGTLTADQIHAALSHEVGVIVEVHNAAALAGNEPGVQNHFIVLAAYDPQADKVYVLNSDFAANIRAAGPQTGDWMTVGDFLLADPRGYIVVAPPVPATPPPPPPVPAPVPAPADTSADDALRATIADLQAQLVQAHILGGVNVAAFKASLAAALTHAQSLATELQAAINSLPG